jgi:hypothetical protein
MGRNARMPFVELPRQSRLFRRVYEGYGLTRRPCDHLVEVKDASRHAAFLHARRIGKKTWIRYAVSVFLQTHVEVKQR